MAQTLRSGPAQTQDAAMTHPDPIPVRTGEDYDPDKSVHTLAYVITKLGGAVDAYILLKIIYFADKQHLNRYGRFLFGDTYVAMKAGPVPSGAYDAVKIARGGSAWCRPHPLAKELLAVNENNVCALAKPDLDFFSESDLECLNEAIEECRNLDWREIWRRSHRDPAFRAADLNGEMTTTSIAKTLPNGEAVLEYLSDPCPE